MHGLVKLRSLVVYPLGETFLVRLVGLGLLAPKVNIPATVNLSWSLAGFRLLRILVRQRPSFVNFL